MLYTKATTSDAVTKREATNRVLAYEAATESIVLLENKGTLPIPSGPIALYGNGAAMTVKGGTGSGEVNERFTVSILEGLTNRGFRVTTHRWLERYKVDYEAAYAVFKKHFRKKLMRFDIINLMSEPFGLPVLTSITENDLTPGETDTCLYVVARQAGEAADRKLEPGDYYLTQMELDDLKLCTATYKNTILVINVGGPIDMGFLDQIEGIGAVLFFSQQGLEGGHALADLLTGAVTPSGRLTDTWARDYGDIPYSQRFSYLDGQLEAADYLEGIYVGYRYYDTFNVTPRYPFGYGLSYTNFQYQVTEAKLEETVVSITAIVKNTGYVYSGKTVLQVYASCQQGQLEKAFQTLATFEKTPCIKPGDMETLTLVFDLKDVASFDPHTHQFILEAGDYILRVGQDSKTTVPEVVVTLEVTMVLSEHAPFLPSKSVVAKLNQMDLPDREQEDFSQAIHLNLSHTATPKKTLQTGIIEPIPSERTKQFMTDMTIKDQVEVVVGVGYMPKDPAILVPGSVGNTTSKFINKGLANGVLCDGPAGLRMLKTSVQLKNGAIKPVDVPIGFMNDFPKWLKKMMTKDIRKGTPLYQFATAFPVGLALAQTWNKDLLYSIGQAISAEMADFGVTYWLAPALNIHRNPLCGRNFEYFSEDPMLSGAMAVALTKGVQATKGHYVTIKHFACNNQEDNRDRMSANVDERALREIYLKGFEMAVKAGAASVMTAYNKINGLYAPNHEGLLNQVLRNEWGFNGVVMTDWFSTGKGKADNGLAIKVGNDLIMPGGRYYKKSILSALKRGDISEADITRCCIRVLNQLFESRTQKEVDARGGFENA